MTVNQSTEQSPKQVKKAPIMLVLISGAFVAILNQTLLATALPHIMHDLDLHETVAQWLQSIFMLVNGIMIPITAFLIDKFSTRALFLFAMGTFGVGTLFAAVAPNFSVLMAGRILQAAGAGIIMPLMQTILFLIFPVDKRGTAMGMFGLVIAFAPAIGPSLSGWIVEQFPWRSLFYIVLPIVIIDIILAYFVLKNVTEQKDPRVDILSIMLSTLGFGGLLYGFSTAGSVGWLDKQVIIGMIVGAITLFFFIIRQLKLKEPILEFRVFKNSTFTLMTALGMLAFLAMIGAAVVLPLFMQNMLGFTAFESGLALLPGAVLQGVMNPITGRLFDKFGAKWLVTTGLAILAVTTFLFTTLSIETTFAYIAIVNGIRMLGIAMIIMPATTAGLNQLPIDLIPHGTAMNNTMRQIAGAIGTALLVTVMSGAAIPDEGANGMIHGVNVSFIVAGVFAIVGVILSFFIKNQRPSASNIQSSARAGDSTPEN